MRQTTWHCGNRSGRSETGKALWRSIQDRLAMRWRAGVKRREREGSINPELAYHENSGAVISKSARKTNSAK